MLNVRIAYGTSYENAVGEAVELYNQLDKAKTFHSSEVDQPNELSEYWRCTIWFSTSDVTAVEKEAEEEKYYYIGSTDVDPNDPNWREKLYGDMNEPLPDTTTVQATPTVEFEVHHVGEVEP